MLIYRITNKVNGKSYIGKTTKTVKQRFARHVYEAVRRDSQTYFHKAIRKYGKENFTYECLEEVTTCIDARETFWIETLQPDYNMTSGGDGGDTSSSERFKASMRKVHAARSPESYASYGMTGKKQSEKFSKAIQKSNNCPVICDGIVFDSVGKAQEHFKGISVRKRLDNPKYPNFYRLRDKTLRPRKV